jgi:beta-glucanase (GH16 family)
MNKKIIALVAVCLYVHWIAFAQTPSNDPHWQLIWEDNFNGSSVNTTKWYFNPPWGNCDGDAHLTSHGGNHEFSNGIIKLVSKKENSVCNDWDGTIHHKAYTTGGLFSKAAFKYGYFEIKCKIPELDNSPYTGRGFSPCFWMWPYWNNCYGDAVSWSEIDFFEIDAEFNKHTCNVHYKDNNMSNKWEMRQSEVFDFNVNFNNFHKFSGEWTSQYINFYFDDQLIRASNTEYASKLIPMNLIIGIGTPAENFGKNFVYNSLFPYNFEIEYVRVYHLKCDKNTVINEIPNFNTYNYAVKKSITMSHVTTIPIGSDIFLRATDFIELKQGFEVPLGTTLFLATTPCDDCVVLGH